MRAARNPFVGWLPFTRLTLAIGLVALVVAPRANAQGKWEMAPVNPMTSGQAFGLWLLTDGRVLSHGSALNNWVILTPDAKGSYVNGTWKAAASKTHGRGGAQQHILKDGRFLEIGGEYVDGPACTPDLCVSGEIYDPVADKWTSIAPAPYDVGDTGSATLDDGRILDSSRKGKQTQIYDPATDSWSMGGQMALNNGDENAWASLQNGGVLAVGYSKDGAAIYDPAKQTWQRTGMVPSGWDTGDTGGISLMFDGRVFVYGLGQSYIYTPGATAADPGTWDLGPKLINGDRAEDEYSDTLPNGKVWGGLVTMTYGPGVVLQEFDPMTNMVSMATPPPDKGNPYPIDYVNLPNGQVMVTSERNDWIYTPDSEPQDDWRPTVSSVVYSDSDKTYTLTGTQLSGLINGADEGDDMTMAENYPIVWLSDDQGNVYYCRTFNFSNMMPHKGDMPQTCQFTTPASLADGMYDLYVSAVGVRSKNAVPFTVGKGGMGSPTSSTGTGGASGGSGTGGMGGAMIGTGGAGGTSMSASTGGAGASSSSVSNAGTNALGMAGTGSNAHAGTGATAGTGAAAIGAVTGTPKQGSSKSGCGCRVTGSSAPPTWILALLFGVAGLRARRFSSRRARRS